MTDREKQLVRDSFYRIREVAGPVSQLFYGRLFELQPGLRRMFHEDLGRQGAKLMEMLSSVVESLNNIESLNPVLHALGKRHVGYGVLAEHYDVVEDALVWSLGHAMAGEFDAEHRAAWRAVIGEVSAAMIVGAKEAHREVSVSPR
jgi:hemoglobin-like flavoprotein